MNYFEDYQLDYYNNDSDFEEEFDDEESFSWKSHNFGYEYEGYTDSDDDLMDALDGHPDAYWNID
ncbi:MAG: hypothetical protein ILA03_03765 [Bacteroidaceae bacterium]|nr:hypothetical protein [Bacteroidaceae bacterium]